MLMLDHDIIWGARLSETRLLSRTNGSPGGHDNTKDRCFLGRQVPTRYTNSSEDRAAILD